MPQPVKVAFVVALSVLVAAPAHAFGGGGKGKRQPNAEGAQNAQKQTKEREEAYKNALKSIPDGKAVNDPWKGAR